MIIRGAAPHSCYYRYYARDDTAADETISTVYDRPLFYSLPSPPDAASRGETYSTPDRNLSNSRTTFGVTFVLQVPLARAHTCTCNTVVCGRTRREPDAARRTLADTRNLWDYHRAYTEDLECCYTLLWRVLCLEYPLAQHRLDVRL